MVNLGFDCSILEQPLLHLLCHYSVVKRCYFVDPVLLNHLSHQLHLFAKSLCLLQLLYFILIILSHHTILTILSLPFLLISPLPSLDLLLLRVTPMLLTSLLALADRQLRRHSLQFAAILLC